MEDLIRKRIFEEGYVIKGFLKNGRILILEDMNKESLPQSLVMMKVSKDTDQMAEEIGTLIDISKKMKKESLSTIADI